MKKLLLAAAVAFFAGVNAQTTGSNLDGTTFITGRVGYDYMKDNNTNRASEGNGSISFVQGTAGMLVSAEVVKDLLAEKTRNK